MKNTKKCISLTLAAALLLTGCGGVLTWCGAAAAALLLKPALTLVESIGYLQDRLNT